MPLMRYIVYLNPVGMRLIYVRIDRLVAEVAEAVDHRSPVLVISAIPLWGHYNKTRVISGMRIGFWQAG